MKDARVLFRWTSRQKKIVFVTLWEMLDGNADDDNAQREAQLEVLLEISTLFFFASTGDKPFGSGLIYSLAVLDTESTPTEIACAQRRTTRTC
jgi:hypothetical protein